MLSDAYETNIFWMIHPRTHEEDLETERELLCRDAQWMSTYICTVDPQLTGIDLEKSIQQSMRGQEDGFHSRHRKAFQGRDPIVAKETERSLLAVDTASIRKRGNSAR